MDRIATSIFRLQNFTATVKSNTVYGFSFLNVSCHDGLKSATSFNRYASFSFSLHSVICFDVIKRLDPLKSVSVSYLIDEIQRLDPLKIVSVSCLDNQTFEMKFCFLWRLI